MPTFKLTVAYDGTNYVGWQRQAEGPSIQALLEDALSTLDQRGVAVTGAGRTDAGVHAAGQVASFSIDRAIDADTLIRAVNARLPPDVRVLTAHQVPSTFHARYRARAKTYRYRIWNGDILSPFARRYVWHLVGALDVGAMARAALLLEGRHDFAAFQAAGSEMHSTDREIFASKIFSCRDIEETYNAEVVAGIGLPCSLGGGELITCEITGDGFLRHMVRNIVGTLVEVGRGRRTPEWVAEVLGSRDRTRAGPTAPAAGLVLMSVDYHGDDRGGSLAADS